MKRYYCTYFDRNYLIKALSLIESLNKYETNDFELFAVCMDEITRIILEKLNLPNVTTIPMHDIEQRDFPLLTTKKNRTFVEYYWTATPTIILRLLEHNPHVDFLTYLDADLYFYSSPDPIFEEFVNQSVLIHEHRFSPSLLHLRRYGKYNVGLLCFRNDSTGIEVLKWWRERCIEWCYIREENGKFGDQLYLNDWTERFNKVAVLKNTGAGVAPWNYEQYSYSVDQAGNIFVNSNPLIFYHFHSLIFVTPDIIIPARYTTYLLTLEVLRLCYMPYIEDLRRQIAVVRAILPDFTFGLFMEEVLIPEHTFIAKGLHPSTLKDFGLPQLQIYLKDGWSAYCSRQLKDFLDTKKTVLMPTKEVIQQVDKKFKVSALVSTYNSEKFIRGCLEDLVNQTLYKKGELEIIVVDSGSQQNERAIVEEFQKKHDNIVYIRTEERETIYAAWNRGIKIANGEYITNANTDDRHKRDALEVMARELDNNPEIALVYADQIITVKENETFDNCTPYGHFFRPPFDRSRLLHDSYMGPQPMWRKALHNEFGYFDETLTVAGDFEWWLRISEKYPFKHIPELLGLYLLNPKGIEHSSQQLGKLETNSVIEFYVTRAKMSGKLANQVMSASKPQHKYVAHYVMYTDDFFFEDSIESVYPYVDKILIARTTKPWFGFPVDLRETEETLKRVIDRFGDKIEIHVGEFPDEPTQRNFLIQVSKEQGYKGAFIVDSDEVFIGNAFKNIIGFIEKNNPQALRIPYIAFIKDASYCVAPPYEDALVYIDLSHNPRFIWGRGCNIEQTFMPYDEPEILHFSYLRKTDEDILRKIKSFSHAHDTDWGKWYEEVYLNFNPRLKNFHPVNPETWRGLQPFDPAKFPKNLLLKLQQYGKLSYLQSERANHLSSKLTLPSTTLVCIDCYNHDLSIKAIEHCLSMCNFDRTIFFTDRDFNLGNGIDVIRIPPISTKEEYSRFVIKELNNYIHTDFVLMIQYDGFIMNPSAWTPEFQKYDYTGAKWHWYNDGYNVGNGGFSLRSKRLMHALMDESINASSVEYGEDTLICRTYRSLLENKYGIRFAPEHIADRFSYERSEFTGDHPFGFHGLFNMWRYLRPEYVPDFISKLSPKTLNSIEALEFGLSWQRLGQNQTAEIVYRKILEFNPGNVNAMKALRQLTGTATSKKTSRNKPCPCGSGRKYKRCCGA